MPLTGHDIISRIEPTTFRFAYCAIRSVLHAQPSLRRAARDSAVGCAAFRLLHAYAIHSSVRCAHARTRQLTSPMPHLRRDRLEQSYRRSTDPPARPLTPPARPAVRPPGRTPALLSACRTGEPLPCRSSTESCVCVRVCVRACVCVCV